MSVRLSVVDIVGLRAELEETIHGMLALAMPLCSGLKALLNGQRVFIASRSIPMYTSTCLNCHTTPSTKSLCRLIDKLIKTDIIPFCTQQLVPDVFQKLCKCRQWTLLVDQVITCWVVDLSFTNDSETPTRVLQLKREVILDVRNSCDETQPFALSMRLRC